MKDEQPEHQLLVRDDCPPTASFEMRPRTLEEAMKFAEIMAASDLVPASYKGKPGNILVACQMGHELGMTPMRALRAITVINGRAAMWGDDMLAMVLASPLCEYVNESESTDKMGICKLKRRGRDEHISIFSLEDAKRAGLLGKPGTWQQYTSRMLKLRARGFGLRDIFADVLAGLVTAEEALDLPPEPTTPLLPATDLKPNSLKEFLKKQAEVTRQEDGLNQGGDEPTGMDPASQDAPAPAETAEPPELAAYQASIKTSRNAREAKARLEAVPPHLRNDCHGVYLDTLKRLAT